MSVGNPTGVQYLRCSKRADSKSCDGCGTLRTREFERFLYGEMVKKLSEFQTLTAKRETVNPKLTALNMELARVEDEIEKLLNTLTGANAVLLSYANSKIEELDTRRQALTKERSRRCQRKPCPRNRLSGCRSTSTNGKKLTLRTGGRLPTA